MGYENLVGGKVAGNSGAGFFERMLSDPNVLQGMGDFGAALSNGATFAEAINPSDMIKRITTQRANKQLLNKLLGVDTQQGVTNPGAVDTQSNLPFAKNFSGSVAPIPEPTPIGEAGPDSVNTNKTADFTKTTITTPNNVQQKTSAFTGGTPLEHSRGTGNSFFKALLQ